MYNMYVLNIHRDYTYVLYIYLNFRMAFCSSHVMSHIVSLYIYVYIPIPSINQYVLNTCIITIT